LRSKRLIETTIWEGEKQPFPKLVMSYNDLPARLSDKIAKAILRCERDAREESS
jgi:hypothetical protein